MTEDDLERLDSSHGATLLECLLIGLVLLQAVVVTVIATWLW